MTATTTTITTTTSGTNYCIDRFTRVTKVQGVTEKPLFIAAILVRFNPHIAVLSYALSLRLGVKNPPDVLSKKNIIVFQRSCSHTVLSSSSSSKPQLYRWNFDPIYDITISGFGGHISTSDCRSLSQSPACTIFELFPVRIPQTCRRNFDPDCRSF